MKYVKYADLKFAIQSVEDIQYRAMDDITVKSNKNVCIILLALGVAVLTYLLLGTDIIIQKQTSTPDTTTALYTAAVTMQVSLPLTKDQFDVEQQSAFKSAIAETAEVSAEAVIIESVEEINSTQRRLLASNLLIIFSILMQDKSTADTFASEVETDDTILSNALAKTGLAGFDMQVAPIVKDLAQPIASAGLAELARNVSKLVLAFGGNTNELQSNAIIENGGIIEEGPVVELLPCAPGFTGPDGGPCVACEAGKYKSTAGSGSCQDCDANTYQENAGSDTCTACYDDTVSEPGSTHLTDCDCASGFVATNPFSQQFLCSLGSCVYLECQSV